MSGVGIATEFQIFRDAQRRVPVSQLIGSLRADLLSLPTRVRHEQLVSLLLAAGELECALADAGLGAVHPCQLTDLLAEAALDDCLADGQQLSSAALQLVNCVQHSGVVTMTTPEGFAYYALHPLDFADLVARLNLSAPRALVVGIRSIGTTLSAVIAAQLRRLGISAERTTVRPAGHPYDRQCTLDWAQRRSVVRATEDQAVFLICDEGPGRSGSSLLSVAEAVEREGAARENIFLLCSHEPDIAALCAPEAARRWSRYRAAATGMTRRLPCEVGPPLSADIWRKRFVPAGDPWPAVWPQMERMKFLARDEGAVFKFEGHGRSGAAVRARNQALAEAGFGADYLGQQLGFGKMRLLPSRALQADDLSAEMLSYMAAYCAWRSREFSCSPVASDELEATARINFEREFGFQPHELRLPVERPAVCDARMQPFEWLYTGKRWMKLDAATHGDDHFSPGPCDIAWDLAGIAVEWELEPSACEFLLSEYLRATGDDATSRFSAYELVYATSRMAWSKMAAASVSGPDEQCRLLRDYRRYRAQALASALRQSATAA